MPNMSLKQTDATQTHKVTAHTRMRAVPISDADAHATFYLSALVDAPQRVQDIYRWVKGSTTEV